jgi:BirA family biotin operon repressor/biotin-[acetyl-CoA-carboxylase] ligase
MIVDFIRSFPQMNQEQLTINLAHLPLGNIEYHSTLPSTNDRALELAKEGAPHFSLVVADEQTRGRGSGRHWFTPAQTALAFSLVLRPGGTQIAPLSHTTGLGALAVCLALEDLCQLSPQIKWPNDVLLQGKKVCGVLTEASWLGELLEALVLGIGMNVLPGAVPPAELLNFPAISLAKVCDKPINRRDLLEAVLTHLTDLWPLINRQEFISAWETRLAYRDQTVEIIAEGAAPMTGKVLGLDGSGALVLKNNQGEDTSIQAGEIHLRPLEDSEV